MWRILSAVLATLVVALVTASVQLAWADAAAAATTTEADVGRPDLPPGVMTLV